MRDQVMGFSLRGIHKDELNMLLGDFPIKREGSQGQNKTYLVALKLAQFDFLIIAFSIFMFIKLITKLTEKKKAETPAAPPAPPAPKMCIRDRSEEAIQAE